MQQEESILQGITWWGLGKEYCCSPGFREGSSGPTSFILRNCSMSSTQSSRFTASAVTKHGHSDRSSQHSGKAEDECGPACVGITICNPCREAGQLAQCKACVAVLHPF